MKTTMKTSNSNQKPPEQLELTAAMEIDITADASDGKSPLPRFTMVAYTGGPMRVAGWRYPVVMDLAGLAIPSQNRPIRFGHDANSGVGHSDSIAVRDGRLIAAGMVSRDTAAAKEIVISARNGFPWQASIGAGVEQFEFVKENQSVLVNGREFTGPINVVRKATLGEISFVDLGADGNTSANVAACGEQSRTASARERIVMEDSKTSTGVADMQNQEQAATLTTAPAVQAAAAVDLEADPVAVMRVHAAAEMQRIAAVRKVCGDTHGELCAQAIRDGWDVTRTELEVLRADRPQAPSVHMPDHSVNGAVLEAACILTGGLQDAQKLCDEKAMDIADHRFKGGIGLQELLLEAAWANGYTGRNFRDTRAILRCAFGGGMGIQAQGLSTIDVGGILSNVANKFLLEGFFSVERTWRNICAVRNVNDFKTVTSYRLIGTDQYEPVAPGGELKHGTLGSESYTNKADTFGLMLSVDRRDIINDDLGAITTVPRKLGRGSGLKINDIFWNVFLANSNFFTAGAKNYFAGATTALGIDSLTQAEQTFMDLVDSEGKPIGIMPSIVLVPTALSAIGTQLYKATEIRDNTSGKGAYPTNNPHANKYRVEVSRYLANSKYTGNSAKAWYLLSDPTDLPVIEVAFLNGQESPTIETAAADFDVLGVQMRGYHDFGVALQDARGGVKVKGEA
jgi:hypothetical protein